MGASVEQLLAALHAQGKTVRTAGAGYLAQCPAHEDHNASLAFAVGDKQPLVLTCHAGCTHADVLRALHLDAPAAATKSRSAPLGRVVQEYVYTDAAGTPRHVTVRYEPKDFRQYHFDATGAKVWNLQGVETVLYRLPAVVAAIAEGRTVYLVEGEKDAETLARWDLCGTTNPQGGKKWQARYTEALAGADVVLVPDTDSTGQAHATLVAKALRSRVARLRVVTLPRGKDVSDFAALGGSRADFLALVEQATTPQAPSDEPLNLDDLTDTGNGHRLAQCEAGRWLYCHPTKTHYLWAGTHWQEDWGRAIEDRIDAYLERFADEAQFVRHGAAAKWALKSRGKSERAAMLHIASANPAIRIAPGELDQHPWLLPVRNGTLDLETGRLRAADPRDRLTRRMDVDYDPRADCPKWLAFLEYFIPDPDVRYYMQRAAGYSLTGSVGEQVFFFLHGGGKNGKSTFLNVLRGLWGSYAALAPSSLLKEDDQSRHPAEKMVLKGRRLVLAPETEARMKLNEALVKTITSTEPISARGMHENFSDFDPTHKLWVYGNHLPTIHGTDEGIWRRVHLVPFPVEIPASKRVLDYEKQLLAEAPGILAWAMLGLADWRRDGLQPPAEVQRAISEYRQAEDPVGQFLADHVLDPESRTRTDVFAETYQRWAKQNGQPEMTQRTINGKLRERGLVVEKQGGQTWIFGVALLAGQGRL